MGQDLAKQVHPTLNRVEARNCAVYVPQPKDLYMKKSSSTDPLKRFSESEVQNMVNVFKKLAALSPKDKFIDRKTFLHYFPLDGDLAERLFRAFDKDGNGRIDCDEFLGGLALCLRGSTEERGQIIFDMFNLDGSEGVSISEMTVMLKSLLSAAARIIQVRENHPHYEGDYRTSADVESTIDEFIRDALSQFNDTTNGKLSKAEFISWMRRHPVILDSVFQHCSIRDKRVSKGFQYDRLPDSPMPPSTVASSHQGTRRTELLSQTWVDGLQQETEEPHVANEDVFSGSYANSNYLWSPVFPASLSMPCARSRHSVCVWDGGLFVYGGRGTRGTLKDFWRYDIGSNTWDHVTVEGDLKPPSLQEHTALTYKGKMYVFGGDFTTTNDTPLWTFSFREKVWGKQADKSWGPTTRRCHSAVLHEASMFVFGGYIDMRGASDELWQYELDTSKWNRIKWKGEGPSPRYSHSAVVGAGGMWVYGGLEGLQVKSDLWRWSFVSHSWSRIKSRGGPPGLFGHSAIKIGEGMLIFGGEATDGNLQNTMWRFDLGNRTWSTVRPHSGISPPIRSCFSMGVVPSSSFLLSIRPSTSLSAPPCTPMPSSFLRNESLEDRSVTRRELREDSWHDPVTQWDITAGSMASLASESMLPNAVAKFAFNKPDKNRPTSLISTVDYQNPREVYENPRGMTLSDDALHEPHDSKVELHLNSSSGERFQTLPFRGVSGVKKGRVQSHELLSVDSSMCTDLRKRLAHPVVCLLVLGGKTRNHTEMGRTLDFWRCDIDPVEKPTQGMEKIIAVKKNSAEKSSNLPHIYLNHSSCSADLDYHGTQVVGGDLELADMSDSDTRSVDLLIDDIDGYERISRSFPKVSI